MKINFMKLLLILILLCSLTACGKIVDDNQDGPSIIDPDVPDKPVDPDIPDTPIVQNVEFTVSLVYNKKIYIPEAGEKITVIWADEYSQYTADIGEDGFAKIKLDGDFNVYLSNIPDNYTYNPNIYKVDNEHNTCEIELYKVGKISKGSGTDEYKAYKITTTGYYRATIKTQTQRVFYEYAPTKSGTYVIESFVNIYDDVVNPIVDTYRGSIAAKYFDKTYNTGGASKQGGYTNNFKWVISLADEEIGNVFTFAIKAESKISYPVTVDFSIAYYSSYELEHPDVKLMVAEEYSLAKIPSEESDPSRFKYINSDGGTGSYYAGVTNGTGLLNGDHFKYNEETKLWHVYYPETNTFGPKLCAKISAPCAYYDQGLNIIEYNGNKALTVSNATENYKTFIEVSYASVCNSDGVCYVTQELKEFLQKFSVSQRLFFDGYGFVETTGVYAKEEDQWLFACGYYVER